MKFRFRVVKEESLSELGKRVEELLNRGWKLYGELIIKEIGNRTNYHQSMTKEAIE